MPRIIPISIFLVLLSILGGFLYIRMGADEVRNSWTYHKQEVTVPTFEDQKIIDNDRAEKDASSYNDAIKAKNTELCDAVMDTKKRTECKNMILAAEALQKKDKDLCNVLTETGIRERCEDNVTFFLAEGSADAILCDMIHDETIRAQCVTSIEESKLSEHLSSGSLDLGFCDSLKDASLKDECTRKISTEKDSELYRLAVGDMSLETCKTIADPVTQAKCKNAVLFDLAVKDGNLEYCTQITNSEQSELCRKSLLKRQDVSRYQQIVRTGELESCNELTVVQMRQQCHDTIIYAKVRESQDDSFCELLYNTGITSQCHEMAQKDVKK